MTEDGIEVYDAFNTKWCPDELIFGGFNDQPITSDYYNLLNDDDDDGNNTPGTTVVNALPDTVGVQYGFMLNDEDINDEIINYDDNSLALYIEPIQE